MTKSRHRNPRTYVRYFKPHRQPCAASPASSAPDHSHQQRASVYPLTRHYANFVVFAPLLPGPGTLHPKTLGCPDCRLQLDYKEPELAQALWQCLRRVGSDASCRLLSPVRRIPHAPVQEPLCHPVFDLRKRAWFGCPTDTKCGNRHRNVEPARRCSGALSQPPWRLTSGLCARLVTRIPLPAPPSGKPVGQRDTPR